MQLTENVIYLIHNKASEIKEGRSGWWPHVALAF